MAIATVRQSDSQSDGQRKVYVLNKKFASRYVPIAERILCAASQLTDAKQLDRKDNIDPLEPRHSMILRMRALDQTLEQCGKQIGVTRQGAQQREMAAVQRLAFLCPKMAGQWLSLPRKTKLFFEVDADPGPVSNRTIGRQILYAYTREQKNGLDSWQNRLLRMRALNVPRSRIAEEEGKSQAYVLYQELKAISMIEQLNPELGQLIHLFSYRSESAATTLDKIKLTVANHRLKNIEKVRERLAAYRKDYFSRPEVVKKRALDRKKARQEWVSGKSKKTLVNMVIRRIEKIDAYRAQLKEKSHKIERLSRRLRKARNRMIVLNQLLRSRKGTKTKTAVSAPTIPV